MYLDRINKKLNKEFGGKVRADFLEGSCSYDAVSGRKNDDASVVISGKLDSWEEILRACNLAVDPKAEKTGCLEPVHHVVNKIELSGISNQERNGMRVPSFMDKSLDGETPDVLIIGGGISGASIARELSKWKLDILLVDKEADLAMQASGRNDGEVHPGVDLSHPSLKLKYVRAGNAIYDTVCNELGVPFKWVGQYVGFRGKWLKPVLDIVAKKKRKLGITDTEIISKDELYRAQPEMSPGYDLAIYNERVGVVCPYGLTIAYAENAVTNGAKVSLETAVLSIKLEDSGADSAFNPDAAAHRENKKIVSVETNRGTVYPKLVINAAGTFSDVIAEMAGDGFFSIHPRRGTNSILDHKAKYITPSIVSFKTIGGNAGHTKGGGILRTAHDNVLIGPDAVETYERENFATNSASIKNVFNKQRIAVGKLSEKDIITYFTGVRAANFEEDFIIERGRKTENIFHVASIQSPGLTAAPAIAKDVEKEVIKILKEYGTEAEANKSYDPNRKPIPRISELDEETRNEMIKQNPDYGTIICRCEEISKGEILDALNSPICVPTIDGIKKRVRPGMGRCQGSFCSPLVSKIIAEFLKKEVSDISKNGGDSVISYGKTK